MKIEQGKEYPKQWKVNDPDAHKKQMRDWYQANKEKVIAKAKERYWADPKAAAAYHADWYKKNKESQKQYSRDYYKAVRTHIPTVIEPEKREILFEANHVTLRKYYLDKERKYLDERLLHFEKIRDLQNKIRPINENSKLMDRNLTRD